MERVVVEITEEMLAAHDSCYMEKDCCGCPCQDTYYRQRTRIQNFDRDTWKAGIAWWKLLSIELEKGRNITMRKAFKGLLVWLFNNVALIGIIDTFYVWLRIKESAQEVVIRFIVFGIVWLLSGMVIIGSVATAAKFKDVRQG